ncbi:MAG: glycosyltransferase family 39 protein [Anaerolineales bacterium]|nr:glycosyltransferase family 39 protein [Chloroflexota bacterium]MBL6980691.1 glycosyltransferase family 39 protein [Anaerolineales bacterium]
MITGVVKKIGAAARSDFQRHFTWLLVIGVALLLRVYALSLYPLSGDEYSTIAESEVLGLNWQSLAYFSLMHVWVILGDSEFWLRLPSVVFGILTVTLIFWLGKKWGDSYIGMIAGILAATSPFLIYHAQELRFYAFFIFAAALYFAATTRLVERDYRWLDWVWVTISGFILIFSHFLGALVLFAQLLVVFTAIEIRWPRWSRVVAAGGGLIGAFAIPLVPIVYRALWRFYQNYAHITVTIDPTITSLSWVNGVKILMAVYVFFFGYHVYPLWWVVILPGLCLMAGLLLLGIVRIIRQRWGAAPFVHGIVLVGVYLILDTLGGRLAGGVAPRHVAFVLPIFLLLLSFGIASLPKRWSYVGLAALVALNLISLWPRWNKTWSYGDLVDYRKAGEFISVHDHQESAIVYDGRSADPVARYFPRVIEKIGYWPYLEGQAVGNLDQYDQLIFVTNDFQADRRKGFNQLLEELQKPFTWTDGYIDYPLFVYVLGKRTDQTTSEPAIMNTGQIRQPLDIYGLEFADLHLPVDIEFEDVPIHVVGAFGLPGLDGNAERVIQLEGAPPVGELILVSTAVGFENASPGETVAEIIIESTNESPQTVPVRLGFETQRWDTECAPEAACSTVYRWHKRIALVGQAAYPSAWRDFQAGLHAFDLKFRSSVPITRMTFRCLVDGGTLYIWGIAVKQ